jgi:hypothetical protein
MQIVNLVIISHVNIRFKKKKRGSTLQRTKQGCTWERVVSHAQLRSWEIPFVPAIFSVLRISTGESESCCAVKRCANGFVANFVSFWKPRAKRSFCNWAWRFNAHSGISHRDRGQSFRHASGTCEQSYPELIYSNLTRTWAVYTTTGNHRAF